MSPALFNLAISDLLLQRPDSADPNLFMDDLAVSVDPREAVRVINLVKFEIKMIG